MRVNSIHENRPRRAPVALLGAAAIGVALAASTGCPVDEPEAPAPASSSTAALVGAPQSQANHAVYETNGIACVTCHPCGQRAPDGHAASWMDTASPSFHAPAANRGLAACQQCHGAALDGTGGSTAVSCASCHGAGWTTRCTFCHGGAESTTGAPPKATWGNAGDVLRVGAHTAHVGGSHGLAPPVACSACHVPQADALSAGHIDPAPAEVVFGGLATAGGATPSWTRATATCASVYCHGATLPGGALTSPVWTVSDGSARACNACHGAPPPSPHPVSTSCGTCHAGYGPSSVNLASHINGTLEVTSNHPAGWAARSSHGVYANLNGLAGCKGCHGADLAGGAIGVSCASCHAASGFAAWDTACTFCHGDRSTGQAAPPLDIQMRSAASNTSVGKHAKHVAPVWANAFACAECHPARSASVIADAAHVDGNGLAEIAFGALARTGGAAATYLRASATSATCASVYCHGRFSGGAGATPSWTSTVALTCVACHGNPPSTGEHGEHQAERIACSRCHGSGYSRTGSTTGTVSKALHVNGMKNIDPSTGWNPSTRRCTPTCHGGETW